MYGVRAWSSPTERSDKSKRRFFSVLNLGTRLQPGFFCKRWSCHGLDNSARITRRLRLRHELGASVLGGKRGKFVLAMIDAA
jgi:hypothetical protein